MKRVTLTAALVVTAAFATAAPAMASSGVAYLRSHQTASGGFANPGSPAGVTTTEWAVMGLRAAGINPAAMRRPGGKTPVDSWPRAHVHGRAPTHSSAASWAWSR